MNVRVIDNCQLLYKNDLKVVGAGHQDASTTVIAVYTRGATIDEDYEMNKTVVGIKSEVDDKSVRLPLSFSY